MSRKQHSAEEIAAILDELDAGLSVPEALRKFGVSKATLYRWRKQARSSLDEEAARLRQVDEENSRLKNLLADAALEIHALKEQLARIKKQS
ncbi:transposase [Sneathiella chinensis]|uniref:Transposase n=1 Tax=Sneathiella chinensis TaxID=349750 RepID=A0ABQ5U3C3_9PROT|nr:transposase [Sneathiella chinensis]GLQ06692.1 transposase [Sneathiella chinensis]